jgi:hypothetical protein
MSARSYIRSSICAYHYSYEVLQYCHGTSVLGRVFRDLFLEKLNRILYNVCYPFNYLDIHNFRMTIKS